MEYVEGESLFDRVERGGPLNSNVVIDFTYQILSGLVYMHSQEIVHRLVCVFRSFNVLNLYLSWLSKDYTIFRHLSKRLSTGNN